MYSFSTRVHLVLVTNFAAYRRGRVGNPRGWFRVRVRVGLRVKVRVGLRVGLRVQVQHFRGKISVWGCAEILPTLGLQNSKISSIYAPLFLFLIYLFLYFWNNFRFTLSVNLGTYRLVLEKSWVWANFR